jgi:hypothetical protein
MKNFYNFPGFPVDTAELIMKNIHFFFILNKKELRVFVCIYLKRKKGRERG